MAFLIKALGAGPGGGAERILATVSTALADRGHKVAVFSFDPPDVRDFYEVGPHVGRVRLGVGQTQQRSGAAVSARRILLLRRAMKAFSPEVAIGFMHSAFIPLAIALIGTRIPVIGSERTSFAHYRDRPLDRLLLRMSVPLLRRLTVNSEQVRQGYPEPIARRMRVLANPVARREFLADPIGPERKRLLCVGGLRPEKDHRTLLSAFALVAAAFPCWSLRIVGDGPLRRSLEEQAAALEIDDRVEFTGGRRNVDDEYRAAQLFVLPSLYEAFPNCIAEALAHGLPVVGFADCPGANELILPGLNGQLATGSDRARGLAQSLTPLMADARLRQSLGGNGPSTIERYSPQAITDEWERLLADAVRTTGSRGRGLIISAAGEKGQA